MPAAAIARWLIGTKLGRSLLLAGLALAIFAWWSAHMEAIGARHEKERQAAAAAAELEQVRGVLVETQRRAQAAIERQHKLEMNNAKLLAAASAPRPGDAGRCLDDRDAGLLDAIRGDQGTRQSARPAAR